MDVPDLVSSRNFYTEGHCANLNRKPVVFDPAGVGATNYRNTADGNLKSWRLVSHWVIILLASELLNMWQASVIKGNAGESAALANSEEVKAKGVDSDGIGFADPVAFVKQLALKASKLPVPLP